jgi:hypothetical protein
MMMKNLFNLLILYIIKHNIIQHKITVNKILENNIK